MSASGADTLRLNVLAELFLRSTAGLWIKDGLAAINCPLLTRHGCPSDFPVNSAADERCILFPVPCCSVLITERRCIFTTLLIHVDLHKNACCAHRLQAMVRTSLWYATVLVRNKSQHISHVMGRLEFLLKGSLHWKSA